MICNRFDQIVGQPNFGLVLLLNGSHTWSLVDHSSVRRLRALQQAHSLHHQRQEEEEEEERAAGAARTLESEAWHTS